MIRTLLVAVLSLGAAAPAFAQDASFDRPYWLDRSVIEALGRAQITVPADTATFSVTFREVDDNSRDAMFAASDRARLAAAAIRSRGGDSVRITSSANIEAIHQEYRNREGERLSSERADQIENYAVSVTLSVTVRDVARAANVRAAAMAVGPEQTSDLSYTLDENAPARLRAYRAAVQDAAARARVAAEGSNAALGGLLVLQEGQGPCLGRWQSGPARNRDNVQNSPTAVTSVDDEIVVTGSRVRELRLTAEDIARMQLPEDVPPLELTAQVCAVYAVG
jgi:uncharacterized protein YggE